VKRISLVVSTAETLSTIAPVCAHTAANPRNAHAVLAAIRRLAADNPKKAVLMVT
jgi:hypothetical protein